MALGFHMGGSGEVISPFDGIIYENGVFYPKCIPYNVESSNLQYANITEEPTTLRCSISAGYGFQPQSLKVFFPFAIDMSQFSTLYMTCPSAGGNYQRIHVAIFDKPNTTEGQQIATSSGDLYNTTGTLSIGLSSLTDKYYVAITKDLTGFGPGGSGSGYHDVSKIWLE